MIIDGDDDDDDDGDGGGDDNGDDDDGDHDEDVGEGRVILKESSTQFSRWLRGPACDIELVRSVRL